MKLGIAMSWLVVSVSFASMALAGDWPSILGPERDGRSPETGIVTQWPEAGPQLIWSRDLGEGYSMPAIVGGRLYLNYNAAVQAMWIEDIPGFIAKADANYPGFRPDQRYDDAD